MMRIKDPKPSLHFYQARRPAVYAERGRKSSAWISSTSTTEVTSLSTSCESFGEVSELRSGYKHHGDAKRADREGLVELTHNHGTETDDSFAG